MYRKTRYYNPLSSITCSLNWTLSLLKRKSLLRKKVLKNLQVVKYRGVVITILRKMFMAQLEIRIDKTWKMFDYLYEN